MVVVTAILAGPLAPLGPRQLPSGIHKTPLSGPILLGPEGLAGDAQGDRKHHGGPEKALHHYPFDHYAFWRTSVGPLSVLDAPGAFGENLTTAGMNEDTVAVGDIFRLGQATIQVSQGRQPCWRLNARFNVPDMARRLQETGFTGWYYRVLETGQIERGDSMQLLERPSPDWTLRRIWRNFYVDTMNRDELAAIAGLDHLAANWRGHAQKRLETHQVENWTRRLDGPTPE